MSADTAPGSSAYQAPHFGKKIVAPGGLHEPVVRSRAHHRDIFVRRKFLGPHTTSDAHLVEVIGALDFFAGVALAENCLLLAISSAARAALGTGYCRCSSLLRRPPDMCEVEWCTLYVCPDILPPKT